MDAKYMLLVARTMRKMYKHAQQINDDQGIKILDDYYAKLCELGDKSDG